MGVLVVATVYVAYSVVRLTVYVAWLVVCFLFWLCRIAAIMIHEFWKEWHREVPSPRPQSQAAISDRR